MKVFKLSMAVVCALVMTAAGARAEEARFAAIAPLVKDAKVTTAPKAAKPKPAAKQIRRKHRDLTPAEWQLENPQLG